ncbi:hypothetical protein RU99_GL002242 [Enterococcus casseliflavus]|nr:hypothetical protein RU99_GL002242 [Enterococcus casseliflavus]
MQSICHYAIKSEYLLASVFLLVVIFFYVIFIQQFLNKNLMRIKK